MLFIAFYIAAKISISDVHTPQENHMQTISYRNCVFIILSIVAVVMFISAV